MPYEILALADAQRVEASRIDDLTPLVHLGGREFCTPGQCWTQSA
jgi:hypothetical protein